MLKSVSNQGGTGSVNIVNDTATASSLYPLFANSISGTTSNVYTSNAKLLYQPSTGNLTSTQLTASALTLASISQSPFAATLIFGSGIDGSVAISSGTITLTKDTQYKNLTISGTGSLNPNGFRLFVAGTLDLSAAPANAISLPPANGGAASGAIGGTIVNASGYNGGLPSNPAGWPGGAGATAGTGIGSAGGVAAAVVSAPYTTTFNGGLAAYYGGSSGAGAFAGGVGSASATSSYGVQLPVVPTLNLCIFSRYYSAGAFFTATCAVGGGAGGSGGGDGTNTGGGGGAGGSGNSAIMIYANNFNIGTNNTSSIITSIGGAGGAGGNSSAGNTGGGGGGAGGGGGVVYLQIGTLLGTGGTNAIEVSGGSGGNGGNGVGTGKGGTGGTAGPHGLYQVSIFSSGYFSNANFGFTPNPAATPTGNAGTAGTSAVYYPGSI